MVLYAPVQLGNDAEVNHQYLSDGMDSTCISLSNDDKSKRWARIDLSTTSSITSTAVVLKTSSTDADPMYRKNDYTLWIGNNGATDSLKIIYSSSDFNFFYSHF